MTVRIGFVGAGYMGQLAHLRQYDRLDDCEVVALAEPRRRLARRVAARHEIDEVYDDHAALLDGAAVDGVVAVQPYTRHHAVVPDVLDAGLPLFTEKPLAASVETAERLADHAASAGVPHVVGYHKRSDPAMAHAKRVVDDWRADGTAGPMRYVRVTMPPGDWRGGVHDPVTTDEPAPEGDLEAVPTGDDPPAGDGWQERSFGRVVNYYVHQLNALRFFFGESYRVTHAGTAGVTMAVESESGVEGVVEMAPYETTADWRESVLVGFERGAVEVDLPPPLATQQAGTVTVLSRADGEQTERTPTLPRESAMRRQARNFLAVVRGERDPPCDSREAVRDLRRAREYAREVAARRQG